MSQCNNVNYAPVDCIIIFIFILFLKVAHCFTHWFIQKNRLWSRRMVIESHHISNSDKLTKSRLWSRLVNETETNLSFEHDNLRKFIIINIILFFITILLRTLTRQIPNDFASVLCSIALEYCTIGYGSFPVRAYIYKSYLTVGDQRRF